MTKKYIYDKLNNKDGAALITVIVIFLTLVVIVTSASYAALGNFRRAEKNANQSSVIYIAEAGLNEAYEELQKFYKDKDSYNEAFTNAFIDYFSKLDGKSKDGSNVKIQYDNVMNKDTYSLIDFSYLNKNDDITNFELKSTGFIGEESRSVKMTLQISKKESTIAKQYQPNAMVSISKTEFATPMDLTLKKIIGPVVTNREIKYMLSGELIGPLVTNKKIDMENHGKWKNGQVITSNEISFNVDETSDIDAIIFKPGGSMNFKLPIGRILNNVVKVKKILLPIDSINNPAQHFKLFGVEDSAVTNHYLNPANTKVAYYNPKNFDPYKYSETGMGNISATEWLDTFGYSPEDPIYGENIKYDYRNFFETDFVLDNKNSMDKYLPEVDMPDKPTFPPNLADIEEEYIDIGWNLLVHIDKKSNLIYHPSMKKELDWSNYDGRYFRSIKFETYGTGDPVNINVGSKNVTVITRELHVDSAINIIGSGTLKIFVVGGTDADPNKAIDESQLNLNLARITHNGLDNTKENNYAHKLQFYIYETKSSRNNKPLTLTIPSRQTQVSAAFFTDNLNLDVYGKFSGYFVSQNADKVIFNNSGSRGNSVFIFAPNAKMSVLGGTFQGVATSKELVSANAGVTFEFDPSFDMNFVEKILPDIIVVEPGNSPGSGNDNGDDTGKSEMNMGSIVEVAP